MEKTKQGEFGWIDLAAKDLEAQTAFYEELFDWTHEDIPTGGPLYRMFHKDGATVGGASQMSPDMEAAGVPTMWNTYIAVDDVDDMAARADALGGKVIMPSMDVMDLGRMVGIADPTGGSVFLWHVVKPVQTMQYGMPGTLAYNDLVTRDPQKAAAFFTELVGWDVVKMDQGPSEYWQAKVDDKGVGGIMPMPDMVPPEVPAYWLVYFGAEDVAAVMERAVAMGATSAVDATEVSGMLVFGVLADPFGATFGLLQPMAMP